MNINIIAGKFSEQNNREIFKILKNRDKSKKNIIVAPDRTLFNLEQRLFDELNEPCFFDVSVISFSKLSKQLLSQHNSKKILTKQSGVALVKKLLIENKDKLEIFTKSTNFMGFANSLFETICLLKSCNISCEEVFVNDSRDYANLKQKDIKLIYTEYEKFLKNDYTDSFNQLKLFANLIDKDFCNNTCYYFVEFDDFTSLMYEIIAKLAKFSEKLYITCTYGKENNNSNIFSNKVYYDLIDLFKFNGLSFNINRLDNYQNKIEMILAQNLLSYEPEKLKINCENLNVTNFENVNDEIKYILADIYNKVIEQKELNFSDFALVVPSMQTYKNLIKEEINYYNIPYYFDENQLLCDHLLIRTIFDIFNLLNNDFSKSEFTSILKSKLLNFDFSDVLNYDNFLDKSGKKGWSCFEYQDIENKEILEFITYLKEWKEFANKEKCYEEYLNNIVLPIYNYITRKLDNFLSVLDPLQIRVFQQVMSKFESINNDFGGVFSKNVGNFDEFVETYKSYFQSTNISLPPITSNTLFVADFNSSYLSMYDYVYILGCNEGKLPSFKIDNGLVTDDEIARLPNAKKINPTIAMLNMRKNFKLFDICFKARKKLYLSYVLTSSEGKLYPNNLVISFIKLFDLNVKDGSIKLNLINNALNNNYENFIFNNLTDSKIVDNILSCVKDWDIYEKMPQFRQMVSSLFRACKNPNIKILLENNKLVNIINDIENANLLNDNTTSISQIETYFDCPYKYFARYGLKANKKKDFELQPNDIGILIHKILKHTISIILQNKSLDFIKNDARKYLDFLLNSNEYKLIKDNPINAYILKALYREIDRICEGIFNEINVSSYKPNINFLEYNFETNKLIKGIKIKGCIDRIDVWNNNFIVIDYKTGDSNFDNYNDVFSGKKLQLLVYAKAFELEKKLKPSGVFYLPINNNIKKTKEDYYKFRGVTLNSKNNLYAIDNNLLNSNYKSFVINLSTTKDAEFYKNNFYNRLCLSEDDFDYLLNYAIKKVEKAVNNITKGKISPSPLKDGQKLSCDYCEYRGLCNYLNNNERKVIDIKTIEDLKNKEKEHD